MTRVLIACDKFKGTLTASEVRDVLAAAIPGSRAFLLADGGDGTLDALEDAGWTPRSVRVTGPTGEAVDSRIVRAPEAAGEDTETDADLRGAVAVEMADLCGLLRLPGGELAPLDAHSTGLGEAIHAAAGAAHIIVGVGGSASTDGGTGMLVGLGARLLDADGAEVEPGARHVGRIARLDLSGVPAALRDTRVTLAADVDAPLLGERGAVAVFGSQKGLEGRAAAEVEAGMAHWADVVAEATGRDLRDEPGAGAAGGVGFALLTVLGARREPGLALVARATGFAQLLGEADLVVTGAGSLDEQTLMGKTVAGVAGLARSVGVRVVAVCGRSTLDEAQTRDLGVERVLALTDLADTPADAMDRAGELLTEVGRRLAAEEGITDGRRDGR